MKTHKILTCLVLFAGSITAPLCAQEDPPTEIILVSVTSGGLAGDNNSLNPSISYDGNRIVFQSPATNFSPDNLEKQTGLYIRDIENGTTDLVVRYALFSPNLSLSSDGQFVSFMVRDGSLVEPDTNEKDDVFVSNTQTGETIILPRPTGTAPIDVILRGPTTNISGNGRFVSYQISFQDPQNSPPTIFAYDIQEKETFQISTNALGEMANDVSQLGSFTRDGAYVTFSARASNLVDEVSTGIFLKNWLTGAVEVITRRTDGQHSSHPGLDSVLSDDAMYIAYTYASGDLLVEQDPYRFLDQNNFYDIYYYDRNAGVTSRVSVSSDETEANGHSELASISADGRYVAFISAATNLVDSDTNGLVDVFVRDTITGLTKRANVSAAGIESDRRCYDAFISGDGRYIVFQTSAENLIALEPTNRRSTYHIYRAPNPFLESVPYVSPDPTHNFLWAGTEGDKNWQNADNWIYKSTGDQATDAPGDPTLGPFHTVEIGDGIVEIKDNAVTVKTLKATGSLLVSQPLTLLNNSNIEDLTLRSNLANSGLLRLNGFNSWNSGVLDGNGSILIPALGNNLTISTVEEFLALGSDLSIEGKVSQLHSTLKLIEGRSVTVETGGQYNFNGNTKITSDQPDSKLVLKNSAKLETTGGISSRTIIDVPLETNGQTKINVSDSSTLEIAQTGVFEKSNESDKIEFNLVSGTRLEFTAQQTFNVPTFFNYKANLTSGVSTVTNTQKLTITEDLSLGSLIFFELGGELDVSEGQFIIKEMSEFTWKDGVIRGGVFAEPNMIQNGIIIDGYFNMGEGIPSGGFVLDGMIKNSGYLTIQHTLYLKSNAKILNEGTIYLRGNSAIRETVGASGKIINISASLRKTDAGISEIVVPIINTGGEITVGGFEQTETRTLILRRSTDFYKNPTLRVSDSGVIEFRLEAEKLSIHGPLKFIGAGTTKLIDTHTLLKTGGDLRIFAGEISTAEGTITGAGGLSIFGGTTTMEENGVIVVEPGGVLRWSRGEINGSSTGSASITNYGLFNIYGSSSRLLNCQVSNIGYLTIKNSIEGSGRIYNYKNNESEVATVILDNSVSPFDIGVRFSNTNKVIVNPGTNATISGETPQYSDGTLSGGEWIIEDEAELTLKPGGISSKISVLNNSKVQINKTGKFNGLPHVSGDLDIGDSSRLFYYNVKDAYVSGQLDIFPGGELRMIGSKLRVTGDLELGSYFDDSKPAYLYVNSGSELTVLEEFEMLPGSEIRIHGKLTADVLDIRARVTFSGSGTINGLIIKNNGLVKPGSSPGILTINGDYEQTETGVLEIEVYGTDPGTEYDQLIINGTATLGGILRIIRQTDSLEDIPYDLLMADSIVGSFDRVIVEAKSTRTTYTVTSTSTAVQIEPATLELSTFAEFQSAIFSTADASDENVGQSTSDPENDGFSNLLEYAMDLNPWVIDSNPISAEFETNASNQVTQIRITFPWAKNTTDVEYILQTSPDMELWTDLSSSLTESDPGEFADLLTLTADMPVPSDAALFTRLLVRETTP